MKQQIIEYLLSKGFERNNDDFVISFKKAVREVIINGHRNVETATIKFCVRFIGEGWLGNSETDSQPTTQWKILVNDVDGGDIIVTDLKDFKTYINKN